MSRELQNRSDEAPSVPLDGGDDGRPTESVGSFKQVRLDDGQEKKHATSSQANQ